MLFDIYISLAFMISDEAESFLDGFLLSHILNMSDIFRNLSAYLLKAAVYIRYCKNCKEKEKKIKLV